MLIFGGQPVAGFFAGVATAMIPIAKQLRRILAWPLCTTDQRLLQAAREGDEKQAKALLTPDAR